MVVRPIKTRVFKEGEDLSVFITAHVPKIKNGSILVVTSKIVALSKGRTADVHQKDAVIKKESEWALKTRFVWLTKKDGMLLANAGVDVSNAAGKLILLPRNSFGTAEKLRKTLSRHYGLKKFGILITDSRTMPLRQGVTALALGYAGFKGLRDYRKKRDLFGRKIIFTQTNVADSLATAAALAMGEGSERQPLCVIEDAPVEFSAKIRKGELRILPENDMYAPFFQHAKKARK